MSRLAHNSKSSVILGKVVCNLEDLNPKKKRNDLINSGRKHLNTYQNQCDLQIKRSQIEVTKNDWGQVEYDKLFNSTDQLKT